MRTRLDIVDFLSRGGEIDGVRFGEEWSGKVSQETMRTCLSLYDRLEPVTIEFAIDATRKQGDVWGAQFAFAREKACLSIECFEQDIVVHFYGKNQESWEITNPSNILELVQTFNQEHGDKFVMDTETYTFA